MNIERLTAIRDWLENGGEDGNLKFNLSYWFNGPRDTIKGADPMCGSTCCIGGYAEWRWGEPHTTMWNQHSGDAEKILGLSRDVAVSLFYPEHVYADNTTPFNLPAVRVAKVIDHLIKTGEVNWNAA